MKKLVLFTILMLVFTSGCITETNVFSGAAISGNEIVFASDKNSTYNELYLMDDDGTNVRRLTFNKFEDSNPAFSPDKKKIVFHRAFDPSDISTYEIYMLNLETGKETRLTNNNVLDGHPDWSPDGKKIVFARYNGNNPDIFIINIETGEETQLTNTDYDENDPEWSPDGKYIAFKSTRHTKKPGRDEIYVMNSDGTGVRRLTSTIGWESDHDPSWSSDSKYIYFERFEGSVPWYKLQDTYYFLKNWEELTPWDVYRVDLKGNVKKITNCTYICWLPVQYNNQIMFLKDKFNFINGTLFSIKVDYETIMPDGSNEQKLLKQDDYAYNKAYFDY